MRLKKLEQLLKDTSAPDVARVLASRPELFGNPFSICLEDVMRGSSDWSVGERELFAIYFNIIDRIADSLDFEVLSSETFAQRAGNLVRPH